MVQHCCVCGRYIIVYVRYSTYSTCDVPYTCTFQNMYFHCKHYNISNGTRCFATIAVRKNTTLLFKHI